MTQPRIARPQLGGQSREICKAFPQTKHRPDSSAPCSGARRCALSLPGSPVSRQDASEGDALQESLRHAVLCVQLNFPMKPIGNAYRWSSAVHALPRPLPIHYRPAAGNENAASQVIHAFQTWCGNQTGQWHYDRGSSMTRRAKRAQSPCINVFRLNPRTGWCLGCGRTTAEVREWVKLTPFRRNRLERELAQRVAKLGQRAPLEDE